MFVTKESKKWVKEDYVCYKIKTGGKYGSRKARNEIEKQSNNKNLRRGMSPNSRKNLETGGLSN